MGTLIRGGHVKPDKDRKMHTPQPKPLLKFLDLPSPDNEGHHAPRTVTIPYDCIVRIIMDIKGVAHIYTDKKAGIYRCSIEEVRDITQAWMNWLRYKAGIAKGKKAASIPSPVYQFISPTPAGKEDWTICVSLQHLGAVVERPRKNQTSRWMATYVDGLGNWVQPEKVPDLKKKWETWLEFMAA